MRGIFFKLFISFFLTVFLSGIISGIVTYSFSHQSLEGFRNEFHEKLKTNIASSTVLIGQAAYVIYENRGGDALEKYIEEIKIPMRTEIFLLIDDIVFPENKYLPPGAEKLAIEARESGTIQSVENEGKLIAAKQYITPEGTSYVVVGSHQMRPPPEFGERKLLSGGLGMKPPPMVMGERGEGPFVRDIAVRGLVLLLMAGLVCYGLARSFSSPINRLRRASQRIAAGDLSTRVGGIAGYTGNELVDLGREFDNMAERMENLIESQKRLLIDISHELRSPLARINVALELARKEYKAKAGGMLDRIEKESNQLDVLVGQLLTLARIENRKEKIDRNPVQVSAMLREIADDVTFEVQGKSKGVVITSLEDVTIEASEELLKRALENIVRNAAYYTAEHTEVELSSAILFHEEKEQLVIHIRDYGPGIPEEDIKSVLRPFYRVSSARDRQSGGEGIGLAIADQAIKRHGGKIAMVNVEKSEGLEVRVFLPLS
ncbi:MAG: HAMP domain-containing protein [Proteobacteria bacterium]|nr:HAMP domain-containing protein [Pseudomonadota bacterium]MBU1057300.1 HAMP domain-containing protein [Pseudomonadota bacterium]